MEVSAVYQLISFVIYNIYTDLELGPKSGSGDLRHVELDILNSSGLVEVDDLPKCMGSELLQPE